MLQKPEISADLMGSSADLNFTLLRKEETLMPNLSQSVYKLTVQKPFPENNTEFQFLRAAAFSLSLRSGFSDLLHNSNKGPV